MDGMTSESKGWKVRWPDNTTTTGTTSHDVLANLAKVQLDPCSVPDMKDLLSHRARVWSGKFIHPSQPDAPFLRELARVGMFKIETEGEE
jgi:hypothetical protein